MIPQSIAVVGASSVFGLMDTEGGFAGRLQTWHRQGNLDKNRVYNLGIPGDTTNDMLKRFDTEVSMRKPDLILFSLGSNDSSRIGNPEGDAMVPLETYKENVRALIEKAKGYTEQVVFVSAYPINDEKTQPLPGNGNYYLLENLKPYVEATDQICEEMEIPSLDIFNMFLERNYLEYLDDDGLHCNPVGHEVIFEETKKFLEKLYR